MGKPRTTKALAELRGRQRWSEEQGRGVVEAWEARGESIPTFARRAGLVPQRVYWWKERLGHGRGRASAVPAAPAFVPMTVRSAPVALVNAAVTVIASDGLRIEVAELDATSAAWVATLVKTLREVVS